MDLFLQFKAKRHSKAYASNVQLQLEKRLIMMGSYAVLFTITNILTNTISAPAIVPLASKMLIVGRGIAILLALIGACLLHRYSQQLKRIEPVLNFILDILIIFVLFGYYPALGNVSVNQFTKLGVFVWTWDLCLEVCVINTVLKYWWMRVVHLLSQTLYFLVFVCLGEPNLAPILIYAIQIIILYLGSSYFQERYQRWDFLDKRKMYDNYEALKKIFDDISQGILIADDEESDCLFKSSSVPTV